MRNRILSIVLAVAMTMSLLVAGAGAEGAEGDTTFLLESVVTTYDDGTFEKSSYTYDENGNAVTETYSDNYGSNWTTYYTYDENGNMLSQSTNDEEDGACYWTYDENGNMLTEVCVWYMDEPITGTTTYAYDANGNLVTETYSESVGSYNYYSYATTYTYEANGNLAMETTTSEDDGEEYTTVIAYAYDESGNVITQINSDNYGYSEIYAWTYNGYGDMLTETYSSEWYTETSTWSYTYDEDGNMLTQDYSDSYGNTYSYSWTYDESGNVLTETFLGSGATKADVYVYEYDEYGNLVVEKEYWGGELEYTTTYSYISTFYDVYTSNYFYNSVTWAVDNEITSGTTATTFSPYNEAERCQVVTFLWRAAGCPEVEEGTENPFTDVDEDDYFYTAVLWAVQEGITSGTSETTFSPYAKCERCQVVTFLYRYAGEPEVTAASNPFTDVDTADYFYNAVLWAVEEGITTGTSDTTFGPFVTCERCMVVTFLYRALAA